MIAVIFLVAALIFFILAAVNVGHPRVNFIGAGLACWVFAVEILPRLHA